MDGNDILEDVDEDTEKPRSKTSQATHTHALVELLQLSPDELATVSSEESAADNEIDTALRHKHHLQVPDEQPNSVEVAPGSHRSGRRRLPWDGWDSDSRGRFVRSVLDNELPESDLEIDQKPIRQGPSALSRDCPPGTVEDGTRCRRSRKKGRGRRRDQRRRRGRRLPEHQKENDAELNNSSDAPTLCSRRKLEVKFADIGWQDFIIAPEKMDAFYCSGECTLPAAKSLLATNHAAVQNLVHMVSPSVPQPCCVPEDLAPVTVMFFEENDQVVLKNYRDMMVKTCACR